MYASCGNSATKSGSWPNFWADPAPPSLEVCEVIDQRRSVARHPGAGHPRLGSGRTVASAKEAPNKHVSESGRKRRVSGGAERRCGRAPPLPARCIRTRCWPAVRQVAAGVFQPRTRPAPSLNQRPSHLRSSATPAPPAALAGPCPPGRGPRPGRPGPRLVGGGGAAPSLHTLPLAAIDSHSLGIYTVILLSWLSFSVKMTVPPPGQTGLRGRLLVHCHDE
jgi:hypothetical protein